MESKKPAMLEAGKGRTGMRKKTEKKKAVYSVSSNVRFMVRRAWQERKSVLIFLVLGSLIAVTLDVLKLFIAPEILKLVEKRAPLPQLFCTIVFFTLALMLAGAASSYIDANTFFGRVEVRLTLLEDLNNKFCLTSYPNTTDPAFLKLTDRAFNAVGNNRQATEAIWKTLGNLLAAIIGFGIYLALLSSLNGWLVLVTLVTAAAGYFISVRLNGWGYRHRDEENEYSHRIFYLISRTRDRTAAKDIRIFGMQPWFADLYHSVLRLFEGFHNHAERIYLWANVADIVLEFARNGIAYVYLIALTLKNGLPASQFLLYFTAIGGFTTWVTGILSQMTTLSRQSLEISIVRECLTAPEPFRFEDGVPLPREKAAPYEITLDHVSFRYPGAGQDTLKNISLTLHPGEKVAVVGRNGAGKTTLVKLLCGFLNPTQGRVLLNGQDIRQYNRRDYYLLFSAVFQQFSLLAATVAENVAQSVEKVDRERVRRCIAEAGLTEKIESLPEKYDTHLNRQVYEDAPELSGGEMQSLMLARALYKDAPVILLDEPTAALDPIAENEIYQKYSELTAGRSSVYISHRLASTRFCDRILLIENGVIAETGTHDGLMKQGGSYAKLYEIQSRYYRKGGDSREEA